MNVPLSPLLGRLIVVVSVVALPACSPDTPTTPGQQRFAPTGIRSTWVSPQPCQIAEPSPHWPPGSYDYLDYGTFVPTPGSSCGVSWSLYYPKLNQQLANDYTVNWVRDSGTVQGDLATYFSVGHTYFGWPNHQESMPQIGPLEITFNSAVKNFSIVMTKDLAGAGGLKVGHYMVALDADGSQLARADFESGVEVSEKSLLVSRIRKVVVYPVNVGGTDSFGNALVEFVYHRASFALDSLPAVKVSCTPSPVVRGSNETCITSLSPAMPFTIIRREAKGTGFTITDTSRTALASGATNSWVGPAVASSDVTSTVEVLQNGVLTTIYNSPPANFVVQKRSWAVWKITNIIEVVGFAPPSIVPYPAIRTDWGVHQIDFPVGDSLITPLARPTAGPNKGLAYLKTAPVVNTSMIGIHPALVKPGTPGRTAHPLSDAWYNDQNGLGSGTCKASDVATLLSNVRRHEGVGIKPNSHPGIANQQFALLRPDTLLEKLYTPLPDTELYRQIDTTMRLFTDSAGPYHTAQRNFDAQDTNITNTQGINCTFDFNLSDQ